MRELVDSEFLLSLKRLADGGERRRYYAALASKGYLEAAMSLKVVTDTGFVGKFANRFAEQVALSRGKRFAPYVWREIGVELMRLDFEARRIAHSDPLSIRQGDHVDVSLGYLEYLDYHEQVFKRSKYDLGSEAWTPYLLAQRTAKETEATALWSSLCRPGAGFKDLGLQFLDLLHAWNAAYRGARWGGVRNGVRFVRFGGGSGIRMLADFVAGRNFYDPNRRPTLFRIRT